MAVKLMNLRNVPDDELGEIHALLESHAIEYYETSAGTFGTSVAALWLVDEAQLVQAKALLEEYAHQRLLAARTEFEISRNEGRARTFASIVKENPFRFILCVALVIALLYFSVVPFVNAMELVSR